MVLTFYYDLLSQPCRSVYIFMVANDIKFTPKELELPKGGHLSQEVIAKNPYHKVPFIDDDGFVLGESPAIMRYLSEKYKMKKNWFGSDPKRKAKIDEFLHWQHTCLRKQCSDTFFPVFTSKSVLDAFPKNPTPLNAENTQKAIDALNNSIKHIEDYFLKGNQFIGGKEISVADIMAYNELTQLRITSQDTLFKGTKKIQPWIERVEADPVLKKILPNATKRMAQMKANFDAAEY